MKKLLSGNINEYSKTNFFGAEFYKLLKYDFQGKHPRYNLLYNVSLSSVYNKKMIILFFLTNLFLFILYYVLYIKFYNRVNNKLVLPLKLISNNIRNSTPIPTKESENILKEYEELETAYYAHLEKIHLRDFSEKLINAQEEERNRIVKELHDSIIQDLSYLLIQLKKLNEDKLSEILSAKISELRNLISSYDTTMLKLYGFNMFLREMVSKYEKKYPFIIFEFNFQENGDISIDFNKQINIVRIMGEIINNAAIHSECSKIIIYFTIKEKNIIININDNGKGFNVEKAFIGRHHFGLINIRERIYILNGRLSLLSNEKGTEYHITIPMNN